MPTKLIAAAVCLLGLAAAPARAQGFLVPYVGHTFNNDAACPDTADCSDQPSVLNLGLALGSHAGAGGFETDFGYARNFFGENPEGGSSVLVLMGNLILGPASGPVRPYGVVGLGLIKSHVDFDVSSLVSADDNNIGWDIGGGLTVGTSRIGVRGDVRRFKTFGDLSLGILPISGEPLKFWRGSVGLFLGF